MARVFYDAGFPGAILDELQDLFEGVLSAPRGDETSTEKEKSAPRSAPLAIDVEHFENEVVTRANVPGVTAEEVGIEAIDELVTITINPKIADETDEVKPEFSHYERPARKPLKRTFRVKRGFDPEGIKAELADGVLTVTVPLKEVPKPVTVKVSTASSAQ